METINKYSIKLKTCIIFPKYDHFANLISMVVEKEKVFLVKMSPMKIINHSLLKHGSSFQGAKESSNHLLGNTYMNPIMISEKQELYWVPTKSPYDDDCIWFALGQYKDYKQVNKNTIEVLFNYGHKFQINITKKSFENKIKNTYNLKYKIEQETDGESDNNILQKGYQIVRDSNNGGYSIKKFDEPDIKE